MDSTANVDLKKKKEAQIKSFAGSKTEVKQKPSNVITDGKFKITVEPVKPRESCMTIYVGAEFEAQKNFGRKR